MGASQEGGRAVVLKVLVCRTATGKLRPAGIVLFIGTFSAIFWLSCDRYKWWRKPSKNTT